MKPKEKRERKLKSWILKYIRNLKKLPKLPKPNKEGKIGIKWLQVEEDIYLTIPKRKKKIIKAFIEYNAPLKAPILKGQKIGFLNIYVAGELKKKIDLISAEKIKKANIFSRLFKSFNYLVWGDV